MLSVKDGVKSYLQEHSIKQRIIINRASKKGLAAPVLAEPVFIKVKINSIITKSK